MIILMLEIKKIFILWMFIIVVEEKLMKMIINKIIELKNKIKYFLL